MKRNLSKYLVIFFQAFSKRKVFVGPYSIRYKKLGEKCEKIVKKIRKITKNSIYKDKRIYEQNKYVHTYTEIQCNL